MKPALPPALRAVPPRGCARENCDRRAIRGREYCNSHWRTWQYSNDPGKRAKRLADNRMRQLADFGITPEQYDQMACAQGGVCAICGSNTPNKNLAVDHDHRCCDVSARSCGRCVRGLLCLQCNTQLGWFERNREAVMAYESKWFKGTRSIDLVTVTT